MSSFSTCEGIDVSSSFSSSITFSLSSLFSFSPKKLNYQWSFSYLTGFTGSIGFSFLFLSFLLPAIASSSEAGGEETEKEESRCAGEMKLGCAFSMECHNTHLWFDLGAFCCRLWRHWVFVLPSGKDKRTTKIVLIPGPELACQDAVMESEAFVSSEDSWISTSRRARAGWLSKNEYKELTYEIL